MSPRSRPKIICHSINVARDGIKPFHTLLNLKECTQEKSISPYPLHASQRCSVTPNIPSPSAPSGSHNNPICSALAIALYTLTFFSSNSSVDCIFRCFGTKTASWPVIRRPSARSSFAPSASLLMFSFFSVETM